MQTAPKQKEAAKGFLNTSEESSKALSAGAVLFGAIESKKACVCQSPTRSFVWHCGRDPGTEKNSKID
jgi:hypothetical protein